MKWELNKGDNLEKKVVNEKELADMLLPESFYMMLKRLKINEKMFHYDTMTEYKRIE